MTSEAPLPAGSPAWFEMVGRALCATAEELAPGPVSISFVERYTDGRALPGGLVQGLRLDLVDGRPSYRVGVAPDERGDVTVELDADAALRLNRLTSADPRLTSTREELLAGGRMTVEGDAAALAWLLDAVHDTVVARTA